MTSDHVQTICVQEIRVIANNLRMEMCPSGSQVRGNRLDVG